MACSGSTISSENLYQPSFSFGCLVAGFTVILTWTVDFFLCSESRPEFLEPSFQKVTQVHTPWLQAQVWALQSSRWATAWLVSSSKLGPFTSNRAFKYSAREMGHKDVSWILRLDLMPPWFFSYGFWVSSCLSPISQNTRLFSSLDWTIDIHFKEGKSTCYIYINLNSIYSCRDI